MKVVQIISNYQPKLGYEEHSLAMEFSKLGHESVIITSNRYFPFENYNELYEPLLGSRIKPPGLTKLSSNTSEIKIYRLKTVLELNGQVLLKDLFSTLKKISPDFILIHGVYPVLSIESLLYCKLSNTPFVLRGHMVPNFSGWFRFINYTWVKLSNIVYRFITPTKIYAINKKYKDFLISQNVNINVKISPLGINTNIFHRVKSSYLTQLKNEYNLKDDDFVILYSGKHVKNKGLDILIEIVKYISKAIENTKLILIGFKGRYYKSQIRNQINQSNIKVIEIPPVHQNELNKFYNLADLGVWVGDVPSISIRELIATGTPVITNRTCGIALSYSKKTRGFIQTGDPESIGDFVIKNLDYIKSDDLINYMTNYALKNFSIHSIAKRLLTLN